MSQPQRHVAVFGLLGLAVLAVSVVGSSWVLHSHASDPSRKATPAASNGVEDRQVVCFGHVDVESGVTPLYPVQPGRVEEVCVKEGDPVRAGAVLLRLDRQAMECRVRQAQADLDAARAQLELARKAKDSQRLKEEAQQAVIDAAGKRLKAAEAQLLRKEELRSLEQVGDQEIVAARAQVDEIRAVLRGEQKKLEELRLNDPQLTIQRAEGDVGARQAGLDLAQLGLRECDVKAPTDGTALRVLVGKGETLGGLPKQPAILFCPAGPRLVRAEVEQEFAGNLRIGLPALILDDATHATTWKGKVFRIADWYTQRRSILHEPLQFNDVRTLECLIALDPEAPLPRIGQRVRVVLGSGTP